MAPQPTISIPLRMLPSLAGPHYPEGLPIWPEEELEAVIREQKVDRCLLSYSDLPHSKVMLLAARCLAGERRRAVERVLPALCFRQLCSRWQSGVHAGLHAVQPCCRG